MKISQQTYEVNTTLKKKNFYYKMVKWKVEEEQNENSPRFNNC